MSLFDTKTILKPVVASKGFDAIEVFNHRTKSLLIKHKENLRDKIPSIEQDTTYHFVNAGRWSAHDLLFHLLELAGPAVVYVATWAMSETAIRLLHQGKDAGLITELHGIFDRRLPIRKAKAAQFVQTVCNRHVLVDCHSKNFLIKNDSWTISSSMTCNYSNNKRIETGFFSTCEDTFLFHKKWMDAVLERKDYFDWK